MYRVLDCIVTLHDPLLFVLAGLLCLFACSGAMTMLARARANNGTQSLAWVWGAGLVSGCGIWGTHFVAMLAFHPGFPLAYKIGLTIFSIIMAVVLCAAGFAVAIRPSTK